MPIQYGVPFYPGFVNSPLLPQIAAGPQNIPEFGKAFDAYLLGQNAARQNQLQDLYASGLPRDAQGNLDVTKAAEMLLQAGGGPQLGGAVNAARTGALIDYYRKNVGQDETAYPGLPPATDTRPALPPSTGRPPAQSQSYTDTGGGEPKPAGQNLVQPDETQPPIISYGPVTGPRSEVPGQTTELSAEQRKVPRVYIPGPGPDEAATPQSPTGDVGQVPGQSQVAPGGLEYSEANAQRLDMAATRRINRANALDALEKGLGDSDRKQAQIWADTAKQIREVLGKNFELTPDQKAAREAGVSQLEYGRRQEAAKADVKDFYDQQTNIQNQATNAIPGMRKAELGKQLTQQPGFYSGPFSEQATTYQQFRNLFGVNAAGAMPNEAFQKVTNDMLQEQIKAMGQSGVGRVLMSEVAIMRRAIASLGITDVSNRALLEMVKRTYQKWQDIAELTRDLPPNSALLNRTVQNYLREHPMFSDDELGNPALLGTKEPPPGATRWSPAQLQQWGAQNGIGPGQPFMFQGNLRQMPGAQ